MFKNTKECWLIIFLIGPARTKVNKNEKRKDKLPETIEKKKTTKERKVEKGNQKIITKQREEKNNFLLLFLCCSRKQTNIHFPQRTEVLV